MTSLTGADALSRGELGQARAAFAAEALAAEAAGVAEDFALAALGRSGLWVHDYRSHLERAQVAACQDRALALLRPEDPLALRLRLRRQAEAHYGDEDTGALEGLLAKAREAQDPVLLAEALHLVYFCLLGPRHLLRRLALAEELIALSPSTSRPMDGLLGLHNRALVLLELGDRRAGRAWEELRAALTAVPCAALSYTLEINTVLRTIGSGHLEEAEALADAARARGEAIGDVDAPTWHAAQLLAIRWFQGRADEMLAICEGFVNSLDVAEPATASFVSAAGVAAADAGQLTLARTCLAQLRSGTSGLPTSTSWLAAQFGIGEMAYALDDADAAHGVLTALTPFASLPVIASRGVVSFGSAHRTLGLAAATLQRWQQAIDHLTQALDDDLAAGTPVARPHTAWILSRVLSRRGEPGDAQVAEHWRTEALAGAEAMSLTGRVAAWHAPTPPTQIGLRRSGSGWQLTCGARRTLLPAAVGLGYLAELLANPGVEIAAVDLVNRYAVREARSRAEPVLDARALTAFRARIANLREQIEQADACGDAGAGARAQTELDALVAELARHTGLGGRARTFSEANERARVAVHRAIGRALVLIERADAEAACRLRAGLSTGGRCRYLPTS